MLYLLISLALATEDIRYFHTGMFEPNRSPGLYEVSIGLEAPGLVLSAFGYFDKDK